MEYTYLKSKQLTNMRKQKMTKIQIQNKIIDIDNKMWSIFNTESFEFRLLLTQRIKLEQELNARN